MEFVKCIDKSLIECSKDYSTCFEKKYIQCYCKCIKHYNEDKKTKNICIEYCGKIYETKLVTNFQKKS